VPQVFQKLFLHMPPCTIGGVFAEGLHRLSILIRYIWPPLLGIALGFVAQPIDEQLLPL
jgi:hypothetical protein